MFVKPVNRITVWERLCFSAARIQWKKVTRGRRWITLGGFLDGWLLFAVPTLAPPPDNANNAHATYYNQQQFKTHTGAFYAPREKCIFYITNIHSLALSIFLRTRSPAAFVINSEHRPTKNGQRRVPQGTARGSCQSFFMPRHQNIDSLRALGPNWSREYISSAAPCNFGFLPCDYNNYTRSKLCSTCLREAAARIWAPAVRQPVLHAKRKAPKFEVRVLLNCRDPLESLWNWMLLYPCLVIMFEKWFRWIPKVISSRPKTIGVVAWKPATLL